MEKIHSNPADSADSEPQLQLLVPTPRPHGALACKYYSDASVRIKFRFGPEFPWIEPATPSWNAACDYEELLPGDPLY